MVRIARSPYPMGEFLSMVRRRFSPPPPRGPQPPVMTFVLAPARAPERWIGFVGDISPLGRRAARYAPELLAFFSDCDFIVGNFEGCITTQRWAPYLHKHTPHIFESLCRLKESARWVLSVANNHAVDFGEADLRQTLARIEDEGMQWVGTAERPRLQLDAGISLTAWTWWVNGRTDAVARQDPGAPGRPGLHIAFPHWGYEHERTPRAEQRARVPGHYPLVVGHHSHLPQPIERQGDRLVAWSLGNFMTVKRLPVLREGAVLKVGVARDAQGTPYITQAHFQEICLDGSDPRYCWIRPRLEG